MRPFPATILLVTVAISPVPTCADPLISDVHLGFLAHDAPFLGPRYETGVDINADMVFGSPVTDADLAGIAPRYRWLLRPAPDIGVDANTAGQTSQIYAGAIWSVDLDTGLWPDHAVFANIGFGAAYNNGTIHSPNNARLSLGSHYLFHPSLEIGDRLTQHSAISVYYEHSSNASIARYNDGLNNIGVRLGFHF